MTKTNLTDLHAMALRGEKIAGVVVWDYQMARIVDRAGVDIVSVGDTVGVNVWGRTNPLDVSVDEMVIVGGAVRRGVERALLSIDFPYGPLQEGVDSAVRCAIRLAREAGADLVKLDGSADFPAAVEAITKAGIPVFAQFGLTPHTALRYGVDYESMNSPEAMAGKVMEERLVAEARRLESAGAALLDFTNSGPVVGPSVVAAVSIPVLGGFGGGPWLDGRIRMANAAIGYQASMLDEPVDTYANVAAVSLEAIGAFLDDVRAGRQIRTGRPRP